MHASHRHEVTATRGSSLLALAFLCAGCISFDVETTTSTTKRQTGATVTLSPLTIGQVEALGGKLRLHLDRLVKCRMEVTTHEHRTTEWEVWSCTRTVIADGVTGWRGGAVNHVLEGSLVAMAIPMALVIDVGGLICSAPLQLPLGALSGIDSSDSRFMEETRPEPIHAGTRVLVDFDDGRRKETTLVSEEGWGEIAVAGAARKALLDGRGKVAVVATLSSDPDARCAITLPEEKVVAVATSDMQGTVAARFESYRSLYDRVPASAAKVREAILESIARDIAGVPSAYELVRKTGSLYWYRRDQHSGFDLMVVNTERSTVVVSVTMTAGEHVVPRFRQDVVVRPAEAANMGGADWTIGGRGQVDYRLSVRRGKNSRP